MKKRFHLSYIRGVVLSLLILSVLCYTAAALEQPKISKKDTVSMSDTMSDMQNKALNCKYSTELNAPFNQASSGINEDIRLDTGELSIGTELVSAPGKNGLDFKLSLNYSSGDASLYAESTADESGAKIILKGKTLIAYYDSFKPDGGYVNTVGVPYTGKIGEQKTIEGKFTEKETGNKLVFTGRYSYAGNEKKLFSTNGMRNIKRALSETEVSNTFGMGWSIAMPKLRIDGEHIYVTLDSGQTYQADFSKQSGLKDYELTNVSFSHYTGAETAKAVSAYKLAYANGYRLYFDKAGLLIEEEDLYKNRITYDYDDEKNLIKMTDSVGRTIDLAYTADTVTIKYGDKISKLIKEEIAPDKWVLAKYIDPLGNTLSYSYNLKAAGFDLIGAGQKAENQSALLTGVHYENGLSTHYEYLLATKNMGSGTLDYYKVSKRYETEKTKGIAAEGRKNVFTYSYLHEPDGYPNYTKGAVLPDSYTYTTRESDELGAIKDYTYNNQHQLVLEVTQIKGEQSIPTGSALSIAQSKYGILPGHTLKEVNRTFYYKKLNLPEKVSKYTYGNEGDVNETADYYGYDNKGNLTSYSTPKEDTPESRQLYTKTTWYDPAYNVKVGEVYRKDQNTTITAINVLDPKGKDIIETDIYANGVFQKKATFEYDANHNMIASRIYDTGSNKLLKTETYGYDEEGLYQVRSTLEKIQLGKDRKENIIQEYRHDRYSGELLSQTDPKGNVTTYTYDKLDRVLVLTNPDRTTVNYAYDDKNNILTTVDEAGEPVKYSYSPIGNLSEIGYPKEGITARKKAYDSYNRLMTDENANGTKAVYSYDGLSRLTDVSLYDKTGTLLSKKEVAYDFAHIEKKTNAVYTKVSITQKGRLSGRETSGGAIHALPVAESDLVKNYYYNRYGELEKEGLISDEGELTESYTYDLAGNVLTYSDKLGQKSSYQYDIFDNLIKETNPKNLSTAYHYDGLFNVDRVTDANGINYRYKYNQIGQLISEELPYQGQETSVSYAEYDRTGNLIRDINALGQKQDYSYDPRGRLLSVTQYDQGKKEIRTLYDYDKAGRLLTVRKGVTKDGNNSCQKLRYEYNGLGDLLSETDESGNTTHYEYDNEGQRIKQTDRNGVITNFTYDGLGRLTQKKNNQDQDKNAVTFEYNLLGNLIRTTDETGVTDYSYDQLARVIQEQIIGKNQGETAGSGIVVKKYGYDKLSRVTNFEIYNNSTLEQGVEYGYNELGQMTSLREGGANYGYEYDKVGRLVKEINPVTNVDTAYTYYTSGDVKSILTDRIENSAFESTSTSPAIEQTEYEYDKLGNVLTKLENKVSYTYSYDRLNRLSTASHDNRTESYNYDKYGNLLKQQTALKQPTGSSINLLTTNTDYSYDASNRLTKMRYDEGEASYSVKTSTYLSYDKEGNLTEKSKWNESGMYGGSKGETDYYQYNGFNQLSEFEKDTGLSQNDKYYYYYNADGLRAKKVKEDLGAENGSGTRSAALDKSSDVSGMATQLTAPKKAFTTNYYYNGGKLVLETDGEGTTTAKTLHGIHLIKREVMNVQGIGLTPTQGSSWGGSSNATPGSTVDKNGNMTYFFAQNSRGDVIKLLNENGDIIRDYEYEPFGKEQDVKTNGYGADYFAAKWKQEVEDNAIDNPFRFGGEYKDNESGNYYLRARYYDPETQRFTQEDTYLGTYGNPMSQNRYAFCGNSPINFVDPSGNVYTKWDKNHGVSKKVIDNATKAYKKAYKAKDKAGMEAAHNMAENERSKHRSKNEVGLATGDTIRSDAKIRAMTPKEELAYKVNEASPYIPGNSLKTVVTGSNYGGYCPRDEREKQDAREGILVDVGTAVAGGASKLAGNAVKGGKAAFESGSSALRRVTEFLKNNGLNTNQRREVIEAFNPGAEVVKLDKDLVVYRYHGGAANPKGRWVTTSPLTNPINQLALPPGSTAENMTQWVIPKGTEVLKGTVAPKFGRPGMAPQIYLPNPNVLK